MSTWTLATAPVLRRRPIPLAEPRAALRVVPEPPAPAPAAQGVLLVLPQRDVLPPGAPAGPRAAPPAGLWTRQFVQAALEVSAGRRPAGQLARWTTDEVFATLSRRAALALRADRAGPVTAAVVRSVRLCHPAAGVVEASAVAVDRGRLRAVALRLEETGGRWRVSALEIG